MECGRLHPAVSLVAFALSVEIETLSWLRSAAATQQNRLHIIGLASLPDNRKERHLASAGREKGFLFELRFPGAAVTKT